MEYREFFSDRHCKGVRAWSPWRQPWVEIDRSLEKPIRAAREGLPIICRSALFAPLWRAARPRSESSVGHPVIICLLFHLPTFMARSPSGPAYHFLVARNRDWAAVTASLSILAHVAQSCCTQAARMPKSRSSTCMLSARCESGTLCRFVFERLRSFQVVLCRPFSFL